MMRKHRRALRIVVQAAVFLLGIAAMGWAVSMALRNRAQLENLAEASAGSVAAMLGLSLATLVINGLIFWLTLRPARRLHAVDVQAVNAIACALSYLPFKIGAVARILLHNRRDRVPLVQIGAWFVAVAVVLIGAFTPPVLCALWLKRIDASWFIATIAGEVIVIALLAGLSMRFKGQRGVQRLAHAFARVRFHVGVRMLHSRPWHHLHSGFNMLAHPRATAGNVALRLADAMVQGLRFMVAAQILGTELGFAPALVISLAYFTAGVVSPVLVGAREASAMAIAVMMLPGIESAAQSAAGIAVFVTATEAVVFLAAGTLGVLWLRPDRMLRRGAPAESCD